jgi:hypothetical protein
VQDVGEEPTLGGKEALVDIKMGAEKLSQRRMGDYPLVNVYITMENHHFQSVNPL